MKNKGLKYILSLMIFSVLLMVGCGGGGSQKVLTRESPEAAVMRISESWRASGNSPKVQFDSNGNFVKQLRAANPKTESESESESDESTPRYIHLYDLKGEDPGISLEIVKKTEIVNNIATVTCLFEYKGDESTSNKGGKLYVSFQMIFDEDKWWLNEVTIYDEPQNGPYYIVEHYYIRDDKKEPIHIKESDETHYSLAGTTVTAKELDSSSGYVFISDYSKNIVTEKVLDINEKGFPLKLQLYYKKLTSYNVFFHILDKENKIVNTQKLSEESISGFVGKTININEDDDIKTFPDSDYIDYKLINEDILEIKYKYTNSLTLEEDSSKNELHFYYKKEEVIPTPVVNETYTFSGVVTKQKLDTSEDTEDTVPIEAIITIYKADEDAKIYEINENGEEVAYDDKGKGVTIETDSEGNYSTKDRYTFGKGKYQLVIQAEGYEPKTVEKTLPLPDSSEENSSDMRANITLK